MNILSSQKSSSLLKVRNNLINETQQMQQQTPKIQNIPYFSFLLELRTKKKA